MTPAPGSSGTLYHLDIDLETQQLLVGRPDTELVITADMPGVTIGVPGLSGPAGPPGMVKVTHGADPNVPRPDAPVVYWVGTVQPLNADPDDLLLLEG